MNQHPVRRILSGPRTRGLAVTAAGLALLTMFGFELAASNHATWQAVFAPGPASLDLALGAICGSLALMIGVWLLTALLLSLLAALVSGSSEAGSALNQAAQVIAPRVLRNAIAALLGATLATTPTVAIAAGSGVGAARSAPTSDPVHPSQVWVPPGWDTTGQETERETEGQKAEGWKPESHLSPGWLQFTSPREPGSGENDNPSESTTLTPRADLLPGWVPGRVLPTTPPAARSPRHAAVATSHPASPAIGAAPEGSRSARQHPESASRASGSASQATGRAIRETQPGLQAPQQSASGEQTPPGPGDTEPGQIKTREIVVAHGDTLWSLAERHLDSRATVSQIAAEWPRWFTANRAVIGSDPNHLVPGEHLRPPGKTVRPERKNQPGKQAQPAERSRRTQPRMQAQVGGAR